jgi:hypothetical protein
VAVLRKVERSCEVGLDLLELDGRAGEAFLDAGELGRDGLLLGCDQVHRDCAAVDGLDELLLLGLERGLLRG